jgi:hypothetical protein
MGFFCLSTPLVGQVALHRGWELCQCTSGCPETIAGVLEASISEGLPRGEGGYTCHTCPTALCHLESSHRGAQGDAPAQGMPYRGVKDCKDTQQSHSPGGSAGTSTQDLLCTDEVPHMSPSSPR